MDIAEFICIGCPMGCKLIIEKDNSRELIVKGNNCKIGEQYGLKEYTKPTRMITTIVKVIGGEIDYVSVKSEKYVPKSEIFRCLKILKDIKIYAPINIGDNIIENINNTGVDIIATKNVKAI